MKTNKLNSNTEGLTPQLISDVMIKNMAYVEHPAKENGASFGVFVNLIKIELGLGIEDNIDLAFIRRQLKENRIKTYIDRKIYKTTFNHHLFKPDADISEALKMHESYWRPRKESHAQKAKNWLFTIKNKIQARLKKPKKKTKSKIVEPVVSNVKEIKKAERRRVKVS